jgi:hypothetical protein
MKTASEISTLIKAALLAVIRAGELPKMKLSVRLSQSNVHASVRVVLTPDFPIMNVDHLSGVPGSLILNERAREIIAAVKVIVDPITDPDIHVFVDFNDNNKEAERAAFRARREAELKSLEEDRVVMLTNIEKLAVAFGPVE